LKFGTSACTTTPPSIFTDQFLRKAYILGLVSLKVFGPQYYMRIEPDSLEHESAAPISYRHESTVDTLKNMHALPNKTSLCIKKKGSQTQDV
jgi:hypothetical protein